MLGIFEYQEAKIKELFKKYNITKNDFLKVLKPEIAICTNQIGKIYPNVKWNLTMVAKVPVFSTAHRNGIIATFTDENEIELTQNIH